MSGEWVMAGFAVSSQPVIQRRPMKTALHQAVLDHRVHQVRLLVSKHGGNVDSRDMYGRTPLMLACLLDNEPDGYRMVRIFLDAGAYVNIRDVMNRSALHYACMKGRSRIVRRFLSTELVEISNPDNDGNTALMLAALSGNPNVVEMLCGVLDQFSVSPDARNDLGYTALMLACKYGHFVSAYTILMAAQSSPALRDNEFFYNALDWTMKSSKLRDFYARQRHRQIRTESSGRQAPPRFCREYTMYDDHLDQPPCRHVRTPNHPLGQSLDTALRLPALFHPSGSCDLEQFVDGVSAQALVRARILELLNSPKYRPVSRNTTPARRAYTQSGSYRSGRNPATAKLRAIDPVITSAIRLNFRDLLDMYSDQYINKLLSIRPRL